ncbi:uncharacterized protein LOC101743837 [Bombyx mori]|uniref:uncharacterized protein LOC101743837 n=1 Tax=Bombyx mori TaxID=7091 RepID=UPI002ED50C49
MLEPEDPGGTSLQVSHVVTIDASGMETEGSIIDTDCSENIKSVKRKRISTRNQKKRRNHKHTDLPDCQLSPNDIKDNVIPKVLESDDKITEIHHNEVANSKNITSNPRTARLLYQASDPAPYDVHIQKILQPNQTGSIHPVQFGFFLKKNSIKSIVEGSIKKIGRNRLSFQFKTFQEANSFLNHKSLDDNKYKAFIPAFTITRMGIVRGVPCDWDEKDVIENIELPQNCGSILKVRRLNRKVYDGETPKFVPTETVVLTFDGKVLPPRVFMCFNSLPVELYIYPTLQCFNCCRFGHTKMQCRGTPRCYKCGDNHSGISCETERDDAVCILCSGSHFATDKKCPEYARQKAIKETMARNSISYSEASKVYPPVSKSYADIVASASSAPSGPTMTYSSPYNLTSPFKSPTQSYKKTVFLKPKARPRNSSKGYDQKAHAELIQDYSNIPSFSTGCLKNYNDLSEIITKDLIISIIQYLSQSNIIKIPSNDAVSSKTFLTNGQSGPSTKPVSGDSMELPEY